MSGFFGGDEKKESSSSSSTEITRSPAVDINATTGGGGELNVSNQGGKVNASARVDSNVRKTIAETTNNSRTALGRIESTIADLRSNTNRFINARVAPLERAVDSRIAQKGRDFATRNIFGGLASAEIDDFRLEGEREIGNARAIASQEALSAVLQAEGVASGVNDKISQGADRLLQADLAELGIDLQSIALSQSSRLQTGQTTEGSSTTTTDDGSTFIGDVFDIASNFVSFAPIGGGKKKGS